ncbi:MAG: hypothetical protein BWY83_02568 [bacterium ADurb.Bin478]|nr:MAG: hypothetical protein BWY83_02568 [bacterium ADurb.Bin478]
MAHIVAHALHRLNEGRRGGEPDMDAIRHFKFGFLAHILRPVDKLTGQSLVGQFFSEKGLNGNGQIALGGCQQTGSVLRLNRDVRRLDAILVTIDHQRTVTGIQEVLDLLVGESADGLRRLVHHLAEFRTQIFKNRLRFFADQFALLFDEFDLLDIELFQHQGFHAADQITAFLRRRDDIDAGQRLAGLDRRLVAQRSTQKDHSPDQIHARFQFLIAIVEQRVAGNRIGGQMHADRLIGLTVGQIAENLLADERRQRRHEPADDHQALPERLIGGALVLAHLCFPEPAARPPHIPVGQIIQHETVEAAAGFGQIVPLHIFIHFFRQSRQRRAQPAIQFRALLHWNALFGLVGKPVDIGVQRKKRISVHQRA